MKRIVGSFIAGFSFTTLLYMMGALVVQALFNRAYGGRFEWFFKWFYGVLEVLIKWPQFLVDLQRHFGLFWAVLLTVLFDVIVYSLVAYGTSFLISGPTKLQGSLDG
jgi:hypothetical protein